MFIRRSSYGQQNKTLFSPVSTRMYALLNTGIGDEMNNGSFYFFCISALTSKKRLKPFFKWHSHFPWTLIEENRNV